MADKIARDNVILFEKIMSKTVSDNDLVKELLPFGMWCIKSFSKFPNFDEIIGDMQVNLWFAIRRIREGALTHPIPLPYIHNMVFRAAQRTITGGDNRRKPLVPGQMQAKGKIMIPTKRISFSGHLAKKDHGLELADNRDETQWLLRIIEACNLTSVEKIVLKMRVEGISYREIGLNLPKKVSAQRVAIIWSDLWTKIQNRLKPSGSKNGVTSIPS